MFHTLLGAVNRLVSRNKLHIFIYHQVLEKPDQLRPAEPTVEKFDWQMALVRRYFTPLSLSEGVERLKAGTLPPNAVCVTFDDGYLNNLTLAQPVLQKYAIPATVYVATAFSDGHNMWNDRVLHLFSQPSGSQLVLSEGAQPITISEGDERREQAYSLLGKLKYLEPTLRLNEVDKLYALNPDIQEQNTLMMSPSQIKELSNLGVDIGAHTQNHPILKVLKNEQQHEEISNSKNLLEQWTGKQVRHFAYPNGVWQKDLDQHTVDIVEQLGFESAVITNWGVGLKDTSQFLLPRFTPWDESEMKFLLRIIKNSLLH